MPIRGCSVRLKDCVATTIKQALTDAVVEHMLERACYGRAEASRRPQLAPTLCRLRFSRVGVTPARSEKTLEHVSITHVQEQYRKRRGNRGTDGACFHTILWAGQKIAPAVPDAKISIATR